MGYIMNEIISAELLKKIEADEKTIAARLKTLRTRVGIEVDAFAEALGVEEAELAAYENGSEDVPASVIALVCALSGVSFEYFFDEYEDEEALDAAVSRGSEKVSAEEAALN
jgi:transcriptional regulator with XRE-family HTH domain